MKKPNKIEQKILDWSERFPLDRWWREKHKIPFMSSAHREVSFLDQLFEWYEDQLVNEYKENIKEDEYIPNSSNFIKFDKNDKSSIIRSMSAEFEQDILNNYE